MKKTIQEGFIGLLWRRGRIIRQLGPGRHRYFLFRGDHIDAYDSRPVMFLSGNEEFATQDNLLVRISSSFMWHITDPARMVRTTGDTYNWMRSAVSDSLRKMAAELTLDELLTKADELKAGAQAAVMSRMKEAGLELDSFAPLTVTIPRSLRQAFEAEVVAKKRALADMEEARGRTAVLRHLANAARQVEDQPVLLQLLMGQKAKHVAFKFDATAKPKSK